MKALKRLGIITILLLVTVIIFASFFGVYKKEDFRVVNIVKKYTLGMDLTKSRVLKYKVNEGEIKTIYDSEGNKVDDDGETEYTEENGYKVETTKINDPEVLTTENYKLAKKIIKNRLKGMKVGEYDITLNEETGEMTVKIQENDNTDETIGYLEKKGVLTIVDKDTQEVLLDNSDIKSVKVVYGGNQTNTEYTTVYLQIDFNNEGAEKLEKISKIYISTTVEEENENGEMEQKEKAKYVSVLVDGTTYSSTYFGETMSTGTLYVPISNAKDSETLKESVQELNNIATVINKGTLPINYQFSEETVEPTISETNLIIAVSIFSGILLIACIVLWVKFKAKGFISTFLQIGYIALVLLLVRYTNVIITVETIAGIMIGTIINYCLVYTMLNTLKKNGKIELKQIGKFALAMIPVYIIAIICTFNRLTAVSSLGMALVWSVFGMYIYNLSITKTVLEMLEKN